MRKPITLLLWALIVTAPSFAKEPVGDWQTVQEDIPRGWQITVVTSFTFPCIFQQASADELVCEQLHHSWGSEKNNTHVRRDRIREIRVEKREGANSLAGAAGAGIAGALLGAAVAAHMGPAALVYGMGGAVLGAKAGRGLHILHGKVIYRQPEVKATEKAASASPLAAQVNGQSAR